MTAARSENALRSANLSLWCVRCGSVWKNWKREGMGRDGTLFEGVSLPTGPRPLTMSIVQPFIGPLPLLGAQISWQNDRFWPEMAGKTKILHVGQGLRTKREAGITG